MVGRQEGHPACKKTEQWSAGMVICLERGADLLMSQRITLPLAVSCFSKIQIGITFLVPAHLGSLGLRAVKRACVYVCVCFCVCDIPYYPTARFQSLSSHMVSDIPFPDRLGLSCTNGVLPDHLPVIVASNKS